MGLCNRVTADLIQSQLLINANDRQACRQVHLINIFEDRKTQTKRSCRGKHDGYRVGSAGPMPVSK